MLVVKSKRYLPVANDNVARGCPEAGYLLPRPYLAISNIMQIAAIRHPAAKAIARELFQGAT